jgi:hypothetical protein
MKNQFKTNLLLVLVLFSVTLHAQHRKVKGNGNVIEITRNAGSFDKIYVSGSFDVNLVEGKEGMITIKAEENLIGLIETVVESGTLKIKWRRNTSVSTRRNIYITVRIKDIDEIKLTGASEITSEKTFKNDRLELGVSGSGSIDLKVETKTLTAAVSGSGNLDLEGKTEYLKAAVSGSGDIDAGHLMAKEVEAKVSGSGDMEINVTERLTARVSGSGDIKYKGKPSIEDIKVSGSGDVTSY